MLISPEILSVGTLLLSIVAIFVTAKFFGEIGLCAYSCIATVASNLQVLKLTQYSCMQHPIALGTELFATVFLVDNILTEYYGSKTAKTNIWLGFCAYLFFASVMRIAMLHPNVNSMDGTNLYFEFDKLFSPSFVLLTASLISYLVSQRVDVAIFSALHKIFKGKHVSIRSFLAMAVSTFVDNCVFSIIAWVILSDTPVGWTTLWYTYIFATYLLRLVIAACCAPLVKLVSVCIQREMHV